MIRINLLAQRKGKRASGGTAEKGQQTFLYGVLALLLVGAGVFFLVDRPLRSDIGDLEESNAKLTSQNGEIEKKLKAGDPLAGIPPEATIKSAVEGLSKRREAIGKIEEAAVTPAWMLRDLGRILSLKFNEQPTMTEATAATLKARPQLAFKGDEFDPRHVWITGFSEKEGAFKLAGGSQGEGDITKLAKRLDASVYFDAVTAEKGKSEVDKTTGVTYYTFTITGRVVY
jgi:Tfp pilus assembly protein PilN